MYRNLSTSDRVLSSQIIYLWNHFSKTTVRHIEKTKENSFQFLSFSFRSMKKKTPQKFKIDSATAEKNPPLKSITSLKKLLNKTPTGIGIISILLWLIIIDYYKHTYLLLYFQKRKDWNEESLPTFHHNVTYQREKLLSIILTNSLIIQIIPKSVTMVTLNDMMREWWRSSSDGLQYVTMN